MILVDLTIWTAAERGHSAGLRSLFNDLLRREELFAPGLVFAQLIAEADDERHAKQFRQWADLVDGLVDSPSAAWTAAGDLHRVLERRGVPVSLLEALLLALSIRETAPIWTFNPVLLDASRLLPIEIYEPPGVNLGP